MLSFLVVKEYPLVIVVVENVAKRVGKVIAAHLWTFHMRANFQGEEFVFRVRPASWYSGGRKQERIVVVENGPWALFCFCLLLTHGLRRVDFTCHSRLSHTKWSRKQIKQNKTSLTRHILESIQMRIKFKEMRAAANRWPLPVCWRPHNYATCFSIFLFVCV